MRLLYFAWVRERIGQGAEEIELPGDVASVGGLIDWLKSRGPGYAKALEDVSVVRVAVNQEFVSFDHPVRAGDEVAIFPPVTGGGP